MRDSQKQRLYDAEYDCFGRRSYPLPNFETTRQYVVKVWRSPWTRKHYRITQVASVPFIADGRGTRIARGGLNRLNLPVWARHKQIVLHEIAHALAPYGEKHGPKFAAIFLALVQHFLGRDDATLLKLSFKKYRVRYRVRKPRHLSFEQLAVLRERGKQLAATRAQNRGIPNP